MRRRDFLCGIAATTPIAVAGCSAIADKDETEKTTHHHVQSSTIRNGVPSDIKQSVFILDLVEKNGAVEIFVSPQIDLGQHQYTGEKQTTVHLIVNDIVDQWQQSWTNQNGVAGVLTFESGSDSPISITAQTEFEEGGSIQTTRMEEFQFPSNEM
ncbi:hypothetical protein [Haloferax larsenii]|uniref:hypothetical protein n=1 Tax=Haloferax larsenii TaxID=302484 RepID=UPI001FCDC4B7|nr:hypothetical protein [Haloferax larsenii]